VVVFCVGYRLLLSRFAESVAVSHLDIDAERGLVWVVDIDGQVWFTTGVSAVQPDGSGHWYQVEPPEQSSFSRIT